MLLEKGRLTIVSNLQSSKWENWKPFKPPPCRTTISAKVMAPLKSCSEGRRGGPETKKDISEGFRRCIHLWFPIQVCLKFVGQTRRKLQVNIWSTDPKPCRTPTRHQQHLRSLRTCMQSRTRTLTQVPLQRGTGKTGNCGTPDWCHPRIFKPWLIRGRSPKSDIKAASRTVPPTPPPNKTTQAAILVVSV